MCCWFLSRKACSQSCLAPSFSSVAGPTQEAERLASGFAEGALRVDCVAINATSLGPGCQALAAEGSAGAVGEGEDEQAVALPGAWRSDFGAGDVRRPQTGHKGQVGEWHSREFKIMLVAKKAECALLVVERSCVPNSPVSTVA